jgi:predicted ATPase
LIRSLTLKIGPSVDAPDLNLTLSPITVFVGPNNSGKSKILSEIESFCTRQNTQYGYDILEDIDFIPYNTDNEVNEALRKVTISPNAGEIINPQHIIVGSKRGRTQIHPEGLGTMLRNPLGNIHNFCRLFIAHQVLKLDGAGRIVLANMQSAGDILYPQPGTLASLFSDDSKRLEVRRIMYDAFGTYFVVDPTNLGSFRIRFSETPPSSPSRERSLDNEAIAFFRKATPVESMSDGVKAFTGIITEVIGGDPGILLIDEPEAFLHPSLSYKLGLELATAVGKTNKRVFASTHSASFLMGCIQSGVEINIVRLTYRSGIATARILANSDIVKLMRNPLLRSTNVLSGLFSEFVVVTEADTDRAFYQEINERLARFSEDGGIPNCLFLHAQNKQTISTIVKALRRLGVPTVAITDIDVIKEGGKNWSALLEAAGFPEIEGSGLAATRSEVNRAMEATGKDMKRDGGINILKAQELEGAKNLLGRLNEYGIYAVPGGEVEAWLKPLGATGHGPGWLIKMFELMEENPESETYTKPADNDVWKFMSDVRTWLINPSRKGLPA